MSTHCISAKEILRVKKVIAVKKFEKSYEEYELPWSVIKLLPLPEQNGEYGQNIQYITPWGLMEFPRVEEGKIVGALRPALSGFR